MSDLGKDSTRIQKVILRDYKLKDLAAIYGVSLYKMRKRIKRYAERIGSKDGHDYNAKQVKLIFVLIPPPSTVRIVEL